MICSNDNVFLVNNFDSSQPRIQQMTAIVKRVRVLGKWSTSFYTIKDGLPAWAH